MGRPRLKVSDWFQQDDKQVEWASNYLTGPSARLPTTPKKDYYAILHFLQEREATADGREFLKMMSGAWRQAKSKAKRDKRTFSYSISNAAAKRLLGLAKVLKKDKHSTLEWLINQDAESRKQADLDRKKEFDDKLAELEKTWGRGITPAQIRDLQWAKRYKAANEVLEKQVVALLKENCEQWTVLVDLGQENKLLTKDQRDRALLRYQDLAGDYQRTVAKTLGKTPKVTVDTSIAGTFSPALFTEDGELTEKQSAPALADAQTPDQLAKLDQNPPTEDSPSST